MSLSDWMQHIPTIISVCGVSIFGAYFLLKRKNQIIAPSGAKQPAWDNPKLVLAARTDLKMGKGKLAAQCAHAAVKAFETTRKGNPAGLLAWKKEGQPKIVVKVCCCCVDE